MIKFYLQLLGLTFFKESKGLYDLGNFIDRNYIDILNNKNRKYFYENKFPDRGHSSCGKRNYYNKTIPKNGKNKKTMGVNYQAKSKARRKNLRKNLEKRCE